MTEKKYVSRSAAKLLGALDAFSVSVTDRVCVDLGAAHGGFTQVLLERGARRVYTFDVAYGMLDWKLRNDPRVVVRERTNVRNLSREHFLPEDLNEPDGFFVTCDISFMSLRTVLRSVREFGQTTGLKIDGIFLLKPQFEASKKTEKGILKDQQIVLEIVQEMLKHCNETGWETVGCEPSVLKGAGGNQEYVLYLKLPNP